MRVVLVKELKSPNGKALWGCWEEPKRLVSIDGETSRRMQWATLFHELFHVALTDSGQDELYGKKKTEALCEASAVARMRERFGQ